MSDERQCVDVTKPGYYVDFPTAWKIAQRVEPPYHHNDCSFNIAQGGLLCDCDILYKSSEYLRAEAESAAAPKAGRGDE